MLCLSRKKNESILVGDSLITVLRIHGDRVRLGVEAKPDVSVDRLEVREKKDRGEK